MIQNSRPAKKIHFIGICGVAMSAVATALHQKGFAVTGSDAGFYPPVSTNLTKLGIPYYSGWHPEKMIESGAPDLVVVGNAVGTQNPEFTYVQEKKIPFISFPEAVGEYLVKTHSVVVSGTYGKTTSSALLAHIFAEAGMDPSYMTGGVLQSGLPSAKSGAGDWSIVEGDEYSTAKWDKLAKFFHYKPSHLLLTAVKWDHADLYPTEKDYFDAFRKLIDTVPMEGVIVACIDAKPLADLLNRSGRKFVSYGESKGADYRYENVRQTSDGISFEIVHKKDAYNIVSPLLGAYNAENITGCFAMAREAGIPAGKTIEGIKSFHGLKRRLEKRFAKDITVIDDIAHSPEKARSVLESLRSIYPGMVVAVYEPNIGNRTQQSKPDYKDAFVNADTVVIPKLTKLKIDPADPEKTFDGQELADTIRESHKEVHYLDSDDELVEFLTLARNAGDVIVFLGSHGFRGMIEATVQKLEEIEK